MVYWPASDEIAAVAKLELGGKCVPKLEFGNEDAKIANPHFRVRRRRYG